MQGYQNLPIDIQTSKLLDWLVDRRHCNLKWQSSVLQIRGKINTAIQDMPENEEIKTLLAGSYIHYFHCLRIVEILKGTEATSKNIFGRYSSQRMKDWQEIVSLYEKDNAYLAEVASLLVRNVSYEIPSLKKQLSKSQQLQQEFSRKEVECQNGAAIMREKFHSSCKQYGITGDNVKRELLALVKDLPSTLGEVGKETCSLSEAIELYAAFGEFVCDWSSEPALPLLRHTQCRGNTTVYEWRTGSPPSLVERPSVEEEGVPATEDSIDWGTLGSDGDSASDGIDYGIAVADGGVDWGISLEPGALEADAGDIDWGEEAASPVEIEVVEMGTNCPEGVARGEDALTLLENPATRNQFIDELMELEVFLTQRLCEMGEEGDVLSMSQFQLAPTVIQSQTRDKVLGVLSLVKGLIERLTSVRMQHLFMIQASPRYVDRVTELLRQKLKQADILVLKQQAMAERRQEALREQGQLEPRIDLLVQRTKELQKQIESDISQRYNNRPVNLMGVTI
ncbi:CDK5 regulatory subunit-associated protein 3 [Huso huso]|uniref:CDK5 regulatory subunit-associated protein 3 n=1 Tax=Huso huso TaxID=61971 RepID=A0ABR0YKJ9_HUSHU